jgi:hypothetical protein
MFVGRKISSCIGLVSLLYRGFLIILSRSHQEFYNFITFYKFRSMTFATHNFLLYPLTLYTLRMVVEGDRNM